MKDHTEAFVQAHGTLSMQAFFYMLNKSFNTAMFKEKAITFAGKYHSLCKELSWWNLSNVNGSLLRALVFWAGFFLFKDDFYFLKVHL